MSNEVFTIFEVLIVVCLVQLSCDRDSAKLRVVALGVRVLLCISTIPTTTIAPKPSRLT